MSVVPYRVGILVISDTANSSPSTDATGPELKDEFKREDRNQWEIPEVKIVRDDTLDVQRSILQWTDGPLYMNLILTAGGTGFAIKDLTPEAVNPLLHKHAPGLVHAMLSASLTVTPFAMMARPVAGVRRKSIIVTLPGSPKGAKENLQAILKLLPHACSQAVGVDSRSLHADGVAKLEKDAGLSPGVATPNRVNWTCPHVHGGSSGRESELRDEENSQVVISRRNRSSPYVMVSVKDALNAISSYTPAPVLERVPVNEHIVGYVLAEDVMAKESVPAFRASIVDGYALGVPADGKNVKGRYPVTAVSHAKADRSKSLKNGTACRITTGAPLPAGSSAVVMVEDTTVAKSTEDGSEELEIDILVDNIKPQTNVREAGSDVNSGEIILRKNDVISSMGGEFGLLASVGVRDISVFKKPVIGVLSTGDEIIPFDTNSELQLGEVRDTNRPTLLNIIRRNGYTALDLGIVSDKPDKLRQCLQDALLKVDVLITSGGVSMGELDLLKPAITGSLNGTIHFGRVAMKPGKPTTFATVDHANAANEKTKKVIFALPGNPASAVVTFFVFVLPSLRQMAGVYPAGLPRVKVRIGEDIQPDMYREEYHRAAVTAGADGLLHTRSTGGQRSSKIGSFKGANALLIVAPGSKKVPTGSTLDALMTSSVFSDL